jgi:FKBP-type peptidyl-prolyl cis-trans isomerase SlyD
VRVKTRTAFRAVMSDEQAADAAEDDEEVAGSDAAESEHADGLQDGDFIRLDYTARTVEDERVIDTTDPDIAEEEGFDEEGREFEPRIVVLGAGHLFEEVESDIVGEDVGYSNVVEIPAAEAFGEYDESQVRTISTDRIDEDDRYPGAQVQIDGEQGIVETIVGGRARVDFNHPLAGEDVEWDFEVVEEIEDTVEKARGLVSTYLDVDLEMWIETEEVEETVVVEDEDGDEETASDEDDEPPEPETETQLVEEQVLYIESDPQLQMNQQWMMGKQQIAQELMDRLELDRVVVQETFEGGPMGMPGMMGGMGGGAGAEGLEEQLEDADVDADEILEELETEGEDGLAEGDDPAQAPADADE